MRKSAIGGPIESGQVESGRLLVVAVVVPAVVMSGRCADAESGTVPSHQKISDTEGSFTGTLADNDRSAYSVASLGDLDGDGVGDPADLGILLADFGCGR